MKYIIALSSICLGTLCLASEPQLIGQINHDKMKNFASVASIVDGDNVCLIASATRSPAGASTDMDCYNGNRTPQFKVSQNGEFMHDGRIKNTSFKVTDSANGVKCYGSLLTRISVSNNTALAGASIKIKCI